MADVNNAAEGVGDDQTLQETPEQTFDRLREALRREIREAVQEATRALEAKMEERLARVEIRMMALEAKYSMPEEGQEAVVKKLEERVQQLEASVQMALEGVIPRVDSLLQQLEGECPPAPLVVPSTSSGSPRPFVLPLGFSAARTSSASPSPLAASPAVPSSTPSTASAPSQPSSSSKVIALGERLYKAVEVGSARDVLILLDEGANVDHRNRINQSPLMIAALFNHADVVSLLLQRGADVNAKCHCGFSSLHYASFHDCSGHCVNLLIDGGAQVHSKNSEGQTPLHCASVFGNEKAVRELIAAGASKTVKDTKGEVPSYYARDPAIREILSSSS